MNESDAQFDDWNAVLPDSANGLPSATESLGINNPNPNAEANYNKEAELRLRKSKQAEMNGGASSENSNNENPEASIRQSKMQNMMKGAGNSFSDPRKLVGDIKSLKGVGVKASIEYFNSLPVSTQVEMLFSAIGLSWGFSTPVTDCVMIYAVANNLRPKIGFLVVYIFASLTFYITIFGILFLIVMVLSFMQMGLIEQAVTTVQAIWDFGFSDVKELGNMFSI